MLAALAVLGVVLLLTATPVRSRLDALADEVERRGTISAVLVIAFMCSGALAALVGVLDAAWVTSALRGGSGTGYGAVLASFAIAALGSALTLHGVVGPVLLGIDGGLVVVAVLFSEARSRLLQWLA